MTKIYPVPAAMAERAHVDSNTYEEMYRRSVEDNEGYWAEQASRIDWMTPFTQRTPSWTME